MKTIIRLLLVSNLAFFIWLEWKTTNAKPSIVMPSYEKALQGVAERLGVKSNWLERTIQAESGGSPEAENEYGHVGHIQFSPSTAEGLGYSTTAIKKMTAQEQLKPIEAFYRPAIGRIHSYEDMRLYTFFPLALGKPDSFVLQALGNPAALIAKRNPSFDTDHDGQITVGEYKSKLK